MTIFDVDTRVLGRQDPIYLRHRFSRHLSWIPDERRGL